MDENANQELPQNSAVPVVQAKGFPVKKLISFVIGFIVLVLIVLAVIFLVVPRFLPQDKGDVVLNYWLIFEDPEPYREIAKEFNRLNPNIRVNIEKQDIKALGKAAGNSFGYIERLDARIDGGNGPDIYRYHVSWLPQMISLLAPLPIDVVQATELDSKYFPLVKEDLKVNGAYYGIPLHFDSLALFINTDLFKASGIAAYPRTWDDAITAANTLTVKDGDGKIITSGIALGTFDNIAHASDIISLLFLQNGADLKDLTGSSAQNSVDALNFYTLFALGDTKVWDNTLENSKLAFAKGKLAMYIGYSWDILELKAINPDLPFVVTTVPNVLERDITLASYWVEGVSDMSPNKKEAFEFLKFLASKENLEKVYSIQAKTRPLGALYPRVDMVELLKDNALAYPFVSQGPTAKSTMFSSDTYDDRMVDEVNKYLGDAVRSIINDRGSPESAIETLAEGVAQKRSQYEIKVGQ